MKRMRENQSRGIKDIESVKQKQAKRDQLEKLQQESGNAANAGGLKWQVG